MHLVDDEHLVAVARRRKRQVANHHLADVVDAGVAGRVDLEDVDIAALGNLDAGVAVAARLGGRPRVAVERPRQDARGRRLAAAMRAGKHERLRDAAAAIAFRSVRVTACCLTTSSNRCGRHLRARTW